MNKTRHQPKGGMCAGCNKQNQDCSSLPFHAMPVIDKDGDTKIVRCTEFKRKTGGASDAYT